MDSLPDLEAMTKPELIVLCRALWEQNQLLKQRVTQLEGQVETLQTRVTQLERQLNKSSKNSSLPPSQDKRKGKANTQRSSGTGKALGPPHGHDGITRKGFGQPDRLQPLYPALCACGEALDPTTALLAESRQVAELVKPIEVTEYQRFTCLCQACGRTTEAAWPLDLLPGFSLGPKLVAWLAVLHARHNQSFAKLESLCRMLDLPVSQGTLSKLLKITSDALAEPVAEIQRQVRQARHNHCDETGWKLSGCGLVLWCAVNDQAVYFWVDPAHTREALQKGIGADYTGTCTSDFHGVYRPYPGQGCWCHLARDVQACLDTPEGFSFGTSLRIRMNLLWQLWRDQHTGKLPLALYRLIAPAMRDEMLTWLEGLGPLPELARKLRKRICQQRERVFWFVEHPECRPDNNPAERALRGPVTNRKVTAGNRSPWGVELKTRLYSVLETCTRQGKPALEFIQNALLAKAHPSFQAPNLFNSC